ncbi:hypothetical protein CANARDRAFT_78564 [[Candida] arabinofermentans NRRL YB-2248]|uniref:Thioesterase domain-containing protein n=1 Tax=[Candida] arabinofermentans NRRL YB-2248 TaxID=983967 RepID=A0A1E4SVZ4_9ASCO|nr:hypothetical protein CANARDRAFT_78564 [[Candida] arabinofermentans NRRL YB-2248]
MTNNSIKPSSTKSLKDQLISNNYIEQHWILNNTNQNLYIGYNCLKQSQKIEEIEIYNKLIYNNDDLIDLNDDCNIIINDDDGDDGDGVGDLLKDKLPSSPISNHLIAIFNLGQQLTSHPNTIHGGLTATLIDEYFIKCCLNLINSNNNGDNDNTTTELVAYTGNLNISYKKAIIVPVDDTVQVWLSCYISSIQGRKVTIKGQLSSVGFKDIYCIGEVLAIVAK